MKNFNIPEEKIGEIVIFIDGEAPRVTDWSADKHIKMAEKELLKETKEMIIEDHLLPEVNDGIYFTIDNDLELYSHITEVRMVKGNKKYDIHIFTELSY